MTPLKLSVALSSILALAVPLFGNCQAQAGNDAPAAALDEVIVTAQRREETAQSTPLAITALSDRELLQRGINDTYDLIGEVPAVSGFESPGARGATTLSIRGMAGGSPLNASLSPAVAIYVDGVYLGKQRSSAFNVADVQRMEVLRGPQGTLYGRNSTGGAINIITQPPSGEFGLKVTGTLGKYGQQDVRLNLDTPSWGDVADPLGELSASFGYQNRARDGFYRNTVPGEPDFMDIDRTAYRVALDWHLSEDTSFDYRYDSSRLRETNNLEKVVGLTSLDAHGNVDRIDAMQDVLTAARGWAQVPGTDSRITRRLIPSLETSIAGYTGVRQRGEGRVKAGQADHMPSTTADVDGHSLTFQTDLGTLGFLGEVELKSITAYREIETSFSGDLEDFDSRLDANGAGLMNDRLLNIFGQLYGFSSGFTIPLVDDIWSAVDQLGAFHTNLNGGGDKYEQFSQEVQLIGSTEHTEYVLGLYYFDDKTTSASGGPDSEANFLAPLLGPSRSTSAKLTSKSQAAFGQVTWTPGWMNEALSITTGLRYTKEDKAISQFQGEHHSLFEDKPAISLSDDDDFHNLSGALTVAYAFNESANSYLTYSTGYLSGGFNTTVFGNSFDEETVEQFELGLKSEWFDRRLRLNVALWTYEWEDGQLTKLQVIDNRPLPFVVNGGTARRWGGELELQAMPAADMLLSFSYAYIDGDFDDYPEVCGTNLPVTCLPSEDFAKRPSSPDNSLSAAVNYVFVRSDWGELSGYLHVNWQDEWYETALWSGVVNGEPVIYDHQVMDQRTVVNARLSFDAIPAFKGRMSIVLWGRNLTDADYPVYGTNLGALGLVTEQYGDPRTYGVEISYAY